MKVIQIGVTKTTSWNRQQYRVYSPAGLAPCLNTVGGGGLEVKIMENKRIKQIGRGYNKGNIHDICPTITTSSFECNNFVKLPNHTVSEMDEEQDSMLGDGERLRKLTPRECFRLMGVDDADIDTIQSAGISNSQQYKLAGNSIVVDVLYYIFCNMFINQ